ncbi:MAG: hypothetical protein AB1428_15215 [Bacteroidota bacterium]
MKHLAWILCLMAVVAANAQVPRTLNYQGTLGTGGTPVPDGNYNVTFRLYTAPSGGSAAWTEAQLVQTRNGVFNAILGKITPLPASFNTAYWLSLQIGVDPELSPRIEMTGVCYSLHTVTADSARKVSDAAITTAMLANNAVTSAKIADGTITGADVAGSTLTAADILDEPGVSVSFDPSGAVLNGGNIVYTIDSVDITIPADGMVMVSACGYLNLFHTTATATKIVVAISKSRATADYTDPGAQLANAPASAPTDVYQYPYATSRTYEEVSSGAKRYYLNAWYLSGSSTSSNVYASYTTALYVPTVMGTISGVREELAPVLGKRGSDDTRPNPR